MPSFLIEGSPSAVRSFLRCAAGIESVTTFVSALELERWVAYDRGVSSDRSHTEDGLLLTPDLADQVRKKAAALRQRPEDLLASVVQRYLDQEGAYLAAVREGIRDLEQGRTRDFEAVKRDVRARMKSRSSS